MKLISCYIVILSLLGICYMPDAYCQSKLNGAKKHNNPGNLNPKRNDSIQANRASKVYCRALNEYIKAIYGKGAQAPDTLFIGKNVDMPQIKLPDAIQNIPVFLITSEAAQKKLAYRKALVYLNIVGWLERDKFEFIIVGFHEFKPQHTCSMHFMRNATTHEMDLADLTFKYPSSEKQNSKSN